MTNEELLISGLEQLGLYNESFYQILQKFRGEIELWNPKLGLVEADARTLVIKHLLDSAAAIPAIAEVVNKFDANPVRIADLGSGAGFPGLVLAAYFASQQNIAVRIDLVEKQKRRCGFLRNAVAIMGLGAMVDIREQGFETLDAEYHIVTSRAFRNLTPEQLKMQQDLLVPGGKVVAMKGRRSTLESELGPEVLKGRMLEISVPHLEDERVIFITPA